MRVQNNTYSLNNLCNMQNIKQAPSFEKREETKYIGAFYFTNTEKTKKEFDEYIDSHPAAIEFFKKYDGDFVVYIDEDVSTHGSLTLRYKHPLHPDDQLSQEIVKDAYGMNSYECLKDIILEAQKVNKSEKQVSLSYENWPSGPDGHDHLSFILNRIDRNIKEDIEAHNKLQAKQTNQKNT